MIRHCNTNGLGNCSCTNASIGLKVVDAIEDDLKTTRCDTLVGIGTSHGVSFARRGNAVSKK